MLVSIIAALDQRGLIGDSGGLPWHLPKDLRRFREFTWGKPIIMGRRTFESIGKPLPGRLNIVLSQNPEYSAAGCRVARTLQEALSIAENHLAIAGGDEVMVIGGGTVYAEAIDLCDRCYVTVVEGKFKGSTFFPIRALLRQNWRPIREPEAHAADEKNPHRHSFHVIERVRDADCRPSQEGAEFTLGGTDQEALDLAAILARGTLGS